ncbi:heparinase II/III domain-containing protein [Parasphingopyxis marina]|uniref:Heparinase II/III family protein n=1 Tax=Parasphingopyxis marina TaxID=2761622 RepID=A0A842HVQ4_9SPHN|nr:heparinase II/III family protein [Parasphingopyxis marina]MBC2776030.1 heparinase II/III family protein [Parasphingopyxis marina]
MSSSTETKTAAEPLTSAQVCARPLRPFEYLEIKPKPGRHRALRDAYSLLADGFELQGERLPSIAAPIDWGFGARSFNFHLHAFLPLNALLSAYDATSDAELLEASLDLALDWIEVNMRGLAPPLRPETVDACLAQNAGNRWYDMAIGQRLYKFAYLLDAGVRLDIDRPGWFEKIADAIRLHHRLLADDRVYQDHNNHGFYQAIDQYAASTRLPELDEGDYRALSRARLAEMIDRQFCEDGVHIEHSPGYHLMVTTTLINARNAGMLDKKLARKIARLESNLGLFITPAGDIATIGDTDPRSLWGDTKYTGFFADPALQYIVSAGVEGTAPEPGVQAMAASGYAIARLDPEQGADEAERKNSRERSYLIQHAGFHSRTHKHADHMSFIWHDAGRDILADPGRYGYVGTVEKGSDLHDQGFFYSAPERIYCESTRAHNCVEIDGASYPRRGVKPWGSALTQADSQGELAVFNASTAHMRTVSHRRSLVTRPGHFLLVLDWLRDRETERDYRQWFCFDPAWDVEIADGQVRASANSPNGKETQELVAVSLVDDSVADRVASGETEPDLLGWLSDRANHLEPATSLSFKTPRGEFGRFATLFILSPRAEPDRAKIRFNSSMRAGRIVWHDDRGIHQVDLNTEEDGRLMAAYRPVVVPSDGETEVNIAAFRAAIAEQPQARIAAIEHQPLPDATVLKDRVDGALKNGWHFDGLDLDRFDAPIDFDAGSRSERYLRHAWAPIGPLLVLADQVEDGTAYLEAARAYTLQWLTLHARPYLRSSSAEFVDQQLFGKDEGEEEFAWYDMGVGLRCHLLACLLDILSRNPSVPDDEIALLHDSLEKHLALLAEAGFQLDHNNHGLYQALGRYAAARRFAWYPLFARHIAPARDQLADIAQSQFFADGMHAEHSPGYHLKILLTLLGARQAGLIDGAEFDEMLAKASDALTWLITPTGGLAAIGDTDPGDWRDQPGFVAWPDARIADLFAGKDNSAPTGLRRFEDAGYAIVRHGDSHLVQACGFHSRTHKHADHLGFVWQEGESPIFIDPGRFEYRGRMPREDPMFDRGFWYADERRRYVEATRAHNCVEIDGLSYNRRVVPNGSSLTGASFNGDAYTISSETTHEDTIRHRRKLVFRPGEWLLILDWLDDSEGRSHDYRQYFQLAPQWRAKAGSRGYMAHSEAGKIVLVDILGNSVAEPVRRGRKTPELQGWHAPGDERFEPSPSLCLAQIGKESARFATLALLGNTPFFGLAGSAMTAEGASIHWKWGLKTVSITLAGETMEMALGEQEPA